MKVKPLMSNQINSDLMQILRKIIREKFLCHFYLHSFFSENSNKTYPPFLAPFLSPSSPVPSSHLNLSQIKSPTIYGQQLFIPLTDNNRLWGIARIESERDPIHPHLKKKLIDLIDLVFSAISLDIEKKDDLAQLETALQISHLDEIPSNILKLEKKRKNLKSSLVSENILFKDEIRSTTQKDNNTSLTSTSPLPFYWLFAKSHQEMHRMALLHHENSQRLLFVYWEDLSPEGRTDHITLLSFNHCTILIPEVAKLEKNEMLALLSIFSLFSHEPSDNLFSGLPHIIFSSTIKEDRTENPTATSISNSSSASTFREFFQVVSQFPTISPHSL